MSNIDKKPEDQNIDFSSDMKQTDCTGVHSSSIVDAFNDLKQIITPVYSDSLIPVILFDYKGSISFINQRAIDQLGLEFKLNSDEVAYPQWTIFNDLSEPILQFDGQMLNPNGIYAETRISGYFALSSNVKQKMVLDLKPLTSNTKDYLGVLGIITNTSDKQFDYNRKESLIPVLQQVLENMANAMIVLDKDRRIVAFNKKYCELLYGPVIDIDIGTEFVERIKYWGKQTNQTNEEINNSIKNLFSSEPYSTEFHDIIDSRTIWLKLFHTPLPDGSVVRTYTDITDLKKAEIISKRNESNFLTFFNTINEMLFVLDTSGLIINVNQKVIDRTGFQITELLGQPITVLHKETDKDEALRTIKEVILGKNDYCFFPILTKSGELIDVETNMQVGEWDGQPAIFVASKDITEQRMTEKLFYHSFQSSFSLMVISDLDTGKILKVNERFLETLGYSENEIIGKTPSELHMFIDDNFVARLGAEIKANNFYHNKETRIRTKLDKIITGLFTGRIVDIQGSKYLYNVIQDITGQLQKVEQEKIISRLLSMLNTKINDVTTFQKILDLLIEYTNIEAIGIRINEGSDFPYLEVFGFPSEFIEKENFLQCNVNNNEKSDPGSNSYVCLCGKVVSGTLKTDTPYTTTNGSLWTNNSTKLEQELLNQQPGFKLRGTCFTSGYKSIALIPIHAGNSIIGLLQLNDKRPDMFNEDEIYFLEQVSKTIGIALDRFRAYTALKESEEKYRSLIENSQDGVFIVHNDRFVFVNEALSDLLSTPITKLLGNKFIEYIKPEDRKFFMEMHYRRLKGESVANQFISNIQNLDGSVSKICRTLVGQTTYQGEPAIMGTVHDITEEILSDELIRKNELFLQAVLKSSLLGISVRSKTGKLLLYNDAWQRIWAIPAEDILVDSNTERVNFKLDNRDAYSLLWWDKITEVYKSGGSLLIPEMKTFGKRKGAAEWIAQYFYAILDEDGEVDRVVVITQDISDRKRQEKALKESEEHYTVLLDSISKAGIGIIMLLPDEYNNPIIHFSNQEFCSMMGFTQNEIIGHSIIKYIAEESQQSILERYQKRLVGKPVSDSVEINIYTKNRKAIPIEAVSTLSKYQNQVFTVTLIRDMSERKNTEEERIKISKLESLGVLAGGIAHDFNNLLAAMMGYTNLLQFSTNDEDSEYLENIEKAIQQASRLTHQLLTFAKGGDPVKKLSQIDEIISRETDFALLGSNIKLDFSSVDPWLVEIDPGQIAQVIQNIVINAKQSMVNGGILSINTKNVVFENDKFLLVTIKDQGEGIPLEHLPRIFDPYFSTKKSGSGLGLAICHSIISKHEGKISVESTLGVGTTFNIWLPASKHINVTPTLLPVHTEEIDYSRLNILIMDDDEFIRDFLVRSFSRYKCNVVSSTNGEEAIGIYTQALKDKHKFDIVILDLTIPGGMGGIEAVGVLQKIDPSVIAIAASGYATDPVMANYSKYGFSYAIGKPFKVQHVLTAISDLLRDK